MGRRPLLQSFDIPNSTMAAKFVQASAARCRASRTRSRRDIEPLEPFRRGNKRAGAFVGPSVLRSSIRQICAGCCRACSEFCYGHNHNRSAELFAPLRARLCL